MTRFSGWPSALRIARREARRAKGRSALVVALIGLPVLGAAFAAASYDMFTLTVEERLARQLGAADAQLNWVSEGPVRQADIGGEGVIGGGGAPAAPVEPPPYLAADVLELLPPGSRVTPRSQGEVRVRTANGIGRLAWQALDLTDPITRGIADVTGGRAPAAAGEVGVTAAAAERLGVATGDRVTLADGGGSYLVVAVVEFPGDPGAVARADTVELTDAAIVFHPDGRPATDWGARWLVATARPVDWEQVQRLNQRGVLVYSRAVVLDPPAALADHSGPAGMAITPPLGTGVIVVGLATLEIVLLAGPAFAVGARRRQRDLGLIAAGGGTPAQLRRVVLADGVVLGTLAAVIGLLVGVAAAFAGRPLMEQFLVEARAGGYRVFPPALLAIGLVAVGTGLLAALVPAFTAARLRVVEALAGRRGITRSRRRWLVLGVGMVALGTAVTGFGAWRVSANLMVAGLVLGQLGLALCTPTLIGAVARLGSRLPLAPRIALRDTARNRAAAAPAVAAVMAAVAGSVAAGMVLLAMEDPRWGDYLSYEFAPGTAAVDIGGSGPATGLAAAEQAVRATLPVAEVYRQSTTTCPAGVDDLGCGLLVTAIPEEKLCPYWQAWFATGELPRAEQRAAARDPRCEGSHPAYGYSLTVDDGTTLPALVGAPAGLTEAARVLRDGGAVVTDERYLAGDGTVTVGFLDEGATAVAGDGRITVPGYLLAGAPPRQGAIVGPDVVRRAGLEVAPAGMLFTTTRMPTQAEEDAFVAAVEGIGTYGWLQRDLDSAETSATLLLLAVAAGVVALGAAGIATGLAAADRRSDLVTLGAVGAGPRVRRMLSLSQSGVIAGLGTGLGMLAGIGGAIAVLVGLNQQYEEIWPAPDPYPIAVPWLNLLVLLAVPLVAMLGAGLFTGSRLPIERRLP